MTPRPYAAMLLPRAETIIAMPDPHDHRAGRIYRGLAIALAFGVALAVTIWRMNAP